MDGQWEDQNRMFDAAGPVLLTAFGVFVLVVYAILLFAGMLLEPVVSAIFITAGTIALVAGIAWGARKRSNRLEER